MEEVSALRPEGAQEIINRWSPFNQGDSPAAHMHQLYLALLQMLVAVRVWGMGKEYTVLVRTYTCKDDLKQVVEDGMLIRNRNFVQLAELVCFPLLCIVPVLFQSHCLTLMCSFAGYHGYPKHDLLASRTPVSAGGCEETTTLYSVIRF